MKRRLLVSASVLVGLASVCFAESSLERRFGAVASESGIPVTQIAEPAVPSVGAGQPVFSSKESRFASLKNWYETSDIPAPAKEALLGVFEGRCYTSDDPNSAQNFRMYGRDWDTARDHDDGPGFPSEHKTIFQFTFRRLNGAIADVWDGVKAARQLGNEWRSNAAAGEDYRLRRYDADPAHFVVKVVENDSRSTLAMCYFFQKVSCNDDFWCRQ